MMIGLEELDWTFTEDSLCLLSYGSWAGISGVGSGFFHLPLDMECPHAPNPP